MLETGIDYQGRRTVRTLKEVCYTNYIRCLVEADMVLKGPCVDGKDRGKLAEGKMHLASCHGDPNARDFTVSFWAPPVVPNLLTDDRKLDRAVL
jgi:hypothetical protein